jgi:hydrogenase maturation protease
MPKSIPLVLGFGNILLGDDGAGVQLTGRLRDEMPGGSATFIDGGTMSFSLLPYLEQADAVLVIDAAEILAAPGAVRLFDGRAMDDFLQSKRRRTVHEVGLIDLLDMARLQGCLPQRRALLCIQPASIDWSETLSSAVSDGLVVAAVHAHSLLRRWSNA